MQEAIDGTCSKIDTRLSDIEDKLYTVEEFHKDLIINSTTDYSYSGLSVTFPEKSYCTITFYAYWNNSAPLGLKVVNSSTNIRSNNIAEVQEDAFYASILSKTYSSYFETSQTYYVWTKYRLSDTRNAVGYYGYCATKYK